MKVAVILVRPEYSGNIGFVARAMANFGIERLILVEPKAAHLNAEAKSRAMRAKRILENAKVVKNLQQPLQDADFSVATTSKTGSEKNIPRTALEAREFADLFSKTNASVAVVFGPEKNGLTNEEIRQCDFIVNIPSSAKYKSLNLSHAAAIIFYELFRHGKNGELRAANRKLKEILIGQFNEMIEAAGGIKNKKDTLSSFKALVARAPASEKETKAVMAVFGQILRKLK